MEIFANQETAHAYAAHIRDPKERLLTQYEGDVIVTCHRGAFCIDAEAGPAALGEYDQAVVPNQTGVTLVCEVAGTLQLIWSPPYGAVNQDISR